MLTGVGCRGFDPGYVSATAGDPVATVNQALWMADAGLCWKLLHSEDISTDDLACYMALARAESTAVGRSVSQAASKDPGLIESLPHATTNNLLFNQYDGFHAAGQSLDRAAWKKPKAICNDIVGPGCSCVLPDCASVGSSHGHEPFTSAVVGFSGASLRARVPSFYGGGSGAMAPAPHRHFADAPSLFLLLGPLTSSIGRLARVAIGSLSSERSANPEKESRRGRRAYLTSRTPCGIAALVAGPPSLRAESLTEAARTRKPRAASVAAYDGMKPRIADGRRPQEDNSNKSEKHSRGQGFGGIEAEK
ncbi:hypothetical protein G7046_g7219 [Stylonectria norvegica]|nr:hypothetical protein G7046_g7219 [Stylonectria norvegica]